MLSHYSDSYPFMLMSEQHPSWNVFCASSPYDPYHFDFTPCFQYSSLALVPIAVLVVSILTSDGIVGLTRRYLEGVRLELGGQGAYVAKISLATSLVALQLASIVSAALSIGVSDYRVTFGIATLASYLVALCLQIVSHKLVPHSSTPLLFFYLVSLLVLGVQLRSALFYADPFEPVAAVLLGLKLAATALVFALECLGPEGWDDASYAKYLPFVPAGTIRLEDDTDEFTQLECPRIRANIFSVLTFSWLSPLMVQGYKKFLTEEDLWKLPPSDTAEALGSRLDEEWARRTSDPNVPPTTYTLIWAIVAAYGRPFFVASIFKIGQDIMSFTQPQLLKRLLQFIASLSTDHPEPFFHGYALAILMGLCASAQTLCLHAYFSRVFETGMRIRSGLVSIIYKKSLRMSNTERTGRMTGDIVNLQSTDATRILDFCSYAQILWSGAFQLLLAFVSLYNLLGWPMFVGVAALLLSMPITGVIARTQARFQRTQMKNKDERTSIMSEILNNIRSIKLYAWEESFAARLFDVRNNKELHMLRKMGFLSSGSQFMWSFTPFVVCFSTFATMVLFTDRPLTSDITFPALSLFTLLGFPLSVIPQVFSSSIESFVSISRITKFLDGGELDTTAVVVEEKGNHTDVVVVEAGEFSWDAAEAPAGDENEVRVVSEETAAAPASPPHSTLYNINLTGTSGKLTALVGRVGSGKSSLLSAILGEMRRVQGSVVVRGSVAYCAQQPWIMGGTIRSNIAFGFEFDPEYYSLVLEACALTKDLEILPQGDLTEVGEKGISLSGGQKARVALARAVYARADIYLLDAPLSAVDAHVGRHLFDKVLGPDGLLSAKARILATNAISFCKQADELVLIQKGTITEKSTFDAAIARETDLARLLNEFGQREDEDEAEDDATLDDAQLAIDTAKLRVLAASAAREVPIAVQKKRTLFELKRSTRPQETREQGAVKRDLYWKFVHANGAVGVFFFSLSICMYQVFSVLTNVWLKTWAQHNSASLAGDAPHGTAFYLLIYGALGLASSLAILANGLVLYCYCVIRASRRMHDAMFTSVVRSPMAFFDTTPIGTVLNRFSRDVFVLDEMLPRVFNQAIRSISQVLSMVVVITVSTPYILAVLVPISAVYIRVQKYYLATSRELKRLDATTKSPIFASFQETLGGLNTIRAYRQTARFIAENDGRIDRNQEAYFPSINCNRWLAIRIEFIGTTIIVATAFLAVYSLTHFSRALSAGTVGLMLTYALSSTQMLYWIVRSSTDVETNIVSVERVQEYIDLPPEPRYDDTDPAVEPVAASWPARGEITFDDVWARYRPGLEPVLRGVSFTIRPGEKVGVCGRTGAGKSSLTMVLYRVIAAERGRVAIDGADVARVSLHALRSRLSIIPQDSQCFEGTLRQNLDPASAYSDAEVWTAIEQCRLKPHIAHLEGGLAAHIEEGGANLSAGMRQLMCLGRALLRQSTILVLDEATAAVDPESDREVQAVIRNAFAHCTLFVIAHRINTILDADKILVMDHGRVKEFDTPASLLSDPSSEFYSLALEARAIKGSSTVNTGANTPAHRD